MGFFSQHPPRYALVLTRPYRIEHLLCVTLDAVPALLDRGGVLVCREDEVRAAVPVRFNTPRLIADQEDGA